MIKNFFGFIWRHKVSSALVLIFLWAGGYHGYQKWFATTTTTRYVTAKVERGALITSISGTGQISVFNQVDIKPKASGDVTYVGAKVGQEVKSGALLVSINARDALKTVRDAQASLDSAQLALDKMEQPADALSVLEAENSLSQANESKQKAEDDLIKAYDDGFNTIANTFLDLPTIMTGLHDLILGYSFGTGQSNMDYYADNAKKYGDVALQYRDDAYNTYQTARAAFDKNFNDYKSTGRFSATSVVEELINESYETTKDIAEAVKSANNLVQFYKDKLTEHNVKTHALADTHLSNLNAYTGDTNSHLSSLLSIKRTIQTDKETIVNSERSIAEKTESLANLKAGADPLDIESQKISFQRSKNALVDAKEKLADYSVRAPFDGVLASFSVKKGDSVSAGAALGTLITKQRIATIALNEIDVAKVKAGQRATLTFDAVEGLSITGEVAEIDALGTVSQGVVSYNVKISFDVQDDRIKPGMSVSASIILDTKPDVLLAPSGAVKTQGNASYVETLVNGAPQQKTVTVGASNDTMTEITGGLTEGEEVVTQKITTGGATAAAANSTARPTGGGFGGGNPAQGVMRMIRD